MSKREKSQKALADTKAAYKAAYDDAIAHDAWVKAKRELNRYLKDKDNE